jgi:hypothetical protein
MHYTNTTNIPEPLATALIPTYDNGGADISVTSLWKPPQMVALVKKHDDEIYVDIDDLVPSFIGTAVHEKIKRHDPSRLKEMRLFANVEGLNISGEFDRYDMDGSTILDYKVTSAKAFMYETHRHDWENQLNTYAFLMRLHGEEPKALNAIVILKDFSLAESRRNLTYPQQQVHVVPLPLWDQATALQRISERVLLHRNGPGTCSPEDMWLRPGKFAVRKDGRKTAVKLCASRSEAETFISMQSDKGKLYVEDRPAIYLRCEDYCSAAPFCQQKAAREATHGNALVEDDLRMDL